MCDRRFRGLPVRSLPAELTVFEATSRRARFLGLSLLDELPSDHALLIPRCRSVHTFGMRFAIDLVFLDRAGGMTRLVEGVRPRRLVTCVRASSVLETRAGEAARFVLAGFGGSELAPAERR